MRIDKSHHGWAWFSAAVLAAAIAWYAWYTTRGSGALVGPSGASWPGLTFGVVGTLFMTFAWLLAPRKKLRRVQRLGHAQFWLRGHLWLGLLSVPMIWFHAGLFRHGGLLTSTLMWLLYAIVISGLIGALLQHFLPRQITLAIPNETVYEQIPAVREHLLAEADCVAAVCGPEGDAADLAEWRGERMTVVEDRYKRFLLTERQHERLTAWVAAAPVAGAEPLKKFYRDDVRPFLAGDVVGTGNGKTSSHGGGGTGSRGATMNDGRSATAKFAQQRASLPMPLHEPLAELERLCDQARQLRRQARWQWLLHGWLYVHVPLSVALLVLTVVHIVVALRYSI